jgi:hypothetical protein
MRLGIRRKIGRIRDIFWGDKNKQHLVPKKKQEWSIGIYEGDSPVSIQPLDDVHNPILTKENIFDVRSRYVADPFMIKRGNTWYMFFEVVRQDNNKGEIGLATSINGLNWEYQRIVLAESFHLSYPYVFQWQEEYYMLPEAWQSGGVSLYKANKFPEQWVCIGKLIEGRRIVDSSIFRHSDMWWILTDTGKDYKSPVLSLYYSKDLMGPWLEHPLSPIINSNPQIARPGGRVITFNGRVVRYAQDVLTVYGKQVYAFEIYELSPTTYKERQISESPIVSSGSYEWNSGGMHNIDVHQQENGKWIACVDGFLWRDVEVS